MYIVFYQAQSDLLTYQKANSVPSPVDSVYNSCFRLSVKELSELLDWKVATSPSLMDLAKMMIDWVRM